MFNRLRTGRPRKVDVRTSRRTVRQVHENPRITRKAIKDDLEQSGVQISLSTVSNILHRAELKGRRPRKTPLFETVPLKEPYEIC